MSNLTLHEYLSKKLEEKRKNHPSFRLMEIDDRLFPNAQTKHSTLEIEALDSNNDLKTVKEIIAESWKKGSKNHLMIEGEGGIGKTVTLLSIPDKFTPFPVSAIYIPLHELPKEDDPIEGYIKKKVLNNKEDLYGQLLDLLDNPWDKRPQLLLLLDGFNEIAAENRQTISKDIEHWSEYPGIQVVTSSRYDIHTYVSLSYDYSAIKFQPLSNTTVEAYLNSMGVRIPTDSAVKELVTIPLLLTLYVKTELVLEQRETDSAEFKEVKNAGSLVWNYLQCELWHFGKEDRDAKNAIIAMEYIAPYMAWQMQQRSLFVLNKKEFHKFLGNAYTLLENHFKKPDDFPFHIKDILQKADGIPPLETIRNLLERQLCLFVKNGNSYKLMHQQFRDALAAIQLINSINMNGNSRPTEWNTTIDHYVMQFVANLISEDEANRLWEQNRTSLQLESATRNQLELQRRLHNSDFSKLDFSGLDLSNISLFPYRYGNTILKLPTNANNMEKTIISEITVSAIGHSLPINAVAISPNDKFIVSGSEDKTIRIWDMESGACLKVLKRHKDWVNAIVITPNGRRIVSGSGDKTLYIWDMENGECLKTLEGHKGWVNDVAIVSDGRRIVSGSTDCTIRVWDMESGACLKILEGHQYGVNAVTITPDGRRIVSGSSDNTIRIWDMENGACLKILEGHQYGVNAVAITPEGRRVVSGSSDNTIRIWDMESGACLKTLEGHKSWVKAVAITPDGKCIVSGSEDETIHIWDLESGACLKTLEGHKGNVKSVAVTSDGRRVVNGSNDTIRVWDMESGTCLKTLEGHEDWVNDIVITPDGRRVISGSTDKTLRIWNVESGVCQKTVEGHEGNVGSVAVTFDGRYIVSGSYDKTLRIWDMESGVCMKTVEGHKERVISITVTPDGRRFVSGSADRTLRIWDMESGTCLKTLKGHKDWVISITVIPDGRRIVSGSADRTFRIWDMESGTCLKTIEEHEGKVNSIVATLDAKRVVSGSNDETIRVWDIETWQCLKTLKGHGHWVRAVAITPDGSRIVSGSDDCTLRVWDMESGACLKTLEGHELGVHTIAVTPDGSRIVSGSADRTIRIWDLENGECLTTIRVLPLSLVGLDFSKAIISTPEMKERLRLNGAKV